MLNISLVNTINELKCKKILTHAVKCCEKKFKHVKELSVI